MRSSFLATIPLLAAFAAVPASAQVRVHVDVPIGRRPVYAVQGRALAISEYDPYRFGAWDSYYDQWVPETVYLYNGYYYDYPIVEYAQPIVVYRFRDQLFFGPRQREFIEWRDHRGIGGFDRGYRPINRDLYQYRAPRENGLREAPQYARPRGSDGRDARPVAPQGGRRDSRPAPQGSGRGAPSRDGGRSGSRGHH